MLYCTSHAVERRFLVCGLGHNNSSENSNLMAEYLEIVGGRPLSGSIHVSGAKNAVLPMLLASLLTEEKCSFGNVPNLADVSLIKHLLEHLGAQVSFSGDTFCAQTVKLASTSTSYSLVKALRASFWVLAPLLARGRAAQVALPGGDIIGARPVDIHLQALQQMGAEIVVKHGVVFATAVNGLRPAKIFFRFPSVGATHQILMAAALTPGTTVIGGAAREPEVVALAAMLNQMGAQIEGAGTDEIIITGCSDLKGVETEIIGDRIEAGTYLLAAAITGGRLRINGFNPEDWGEFSGIIADCGLEVKYGLDYAELIQIGELKPQRVITSPFPGFATDLQAPLMAFLTLVSGESVLEEAVYEGRFGHVSELCRMGAKISVVGRTASLTGVSQLTSAQVEGFDIRAAASLVLAGLAANGKTQLYEPDHIRRGYDGLECKLQKVGAQICYGYDDEDDYHSIGC